MFKRHFSQSCLVCVRCLGRSMSGLHAALPFSSRVELSQHATLESVSAAAVKSDLKLLSPYTRGKLSYNQLRD